MYKYKFEFLDTQPLGDYMKSKNINKMVLHQGIDGMHYAVGCDKSGYGFVIPLASTVKGLHLDLNVCWVTNPKYKKHPKEFVLICRSKFSRVADKDLSNTISIHKENEL